MHLSPADLRARDRADTLVIDVRTPGEHAAGHVPGAVNVPLDSLHELLPELGRAVVRRELVAVCASGQRSATAVARLAEAGIAARSLDGGTQAWERAGLPLRTPGDAPASAVWAMDRQVRLTAGALVLAGLAIGGRAPRGRLLSAAVASGLVYSALSNTCAMATALGKLPFNRPRPGALDTARRALRG
ncbi:rhodanese-like domain-containing protein [Streptomyces sp. NPDC001941]|uniref:rhodanese-like domain-containing protein n=1 Tax=Streptomyces sp. NPDC001941 TaxID=3154659 RepID=UPI00331C3A96